MSELHFDVFGRLITVVAGDDGWKAFIVGSEGKRRPADFVIPSNIQEDGLIRYLADLFHEYETSEKSSVIRIG